jgi:haloalkane dehalogenase
MIDRGPTRPEWVPDDLYPFADRWADIEGNLVHFVDEGVGPPILLLNGNPSWSFGWRDVILRLRGTFRCIAPDHPGFGLSQPADGYDFRARSHSRILERLVERLDLRDLVVFGYAWGGPLGLGLAGRRPERVRAIVGRADLGVARPTVPRAPLLVPHGRAAQPAARRSPRS